MHTVHGKENGMNENSRTTGKDHDAPQGLGGITWEWKARHLLTDKFVLLDFVKVVLIAGGGMTLLLMIAVSFKGDMSTVLNMAVFGAVITGGLALLFLLIMAVIGGRLRYRFTVDDTGVTFEMLSGFVKKTNKLAIILGVLARNPGLAGAGLLARTEEYNRIDFKDLTKVRDYPDDRVIFIRGRYNPKPIRLYCPPELYGGVAAAIRTGLDQGRQARAQEIRELGPSALPRRFKTSLAVLVATLLLFVSPLPVHPLVPTAAGLLALAALWLAPLRKPLAALLVLSLCGLVLLLGQELFTVRVTTTEEEFLAYARSQGVQLDAVHPSLLGNYAPYQTFHAEEWVGLGVCLAGALILAGVGVAAFAGAFLRKKPGKESA
jgi:hypothetical protein